MSGCYSWERIKPSQLPKLNGAYSRVTGTTYTPSGSIANVEQTVAHVERPDGTLMEIKGNFDARVSVRSEEFLFEHPVNATTEDKVLVVTGGNRPATSFELSTVRRVEVSQFDLAATSVLSAMLGLVVGGALIAIVIATIH